MVIFWVVAPYVMAVAGIYAWLAFRFGWWNVQLNRWIGDRVHLRDRLLWRSRPRRYYSRMELWRRPDGSMYYWMQRTWEAQCPWPCSRWGEVWRAWTFGYDPKLNPIATMRKAFDGSSIKIKWRCYKCAREYEFEGNLLMTSEFASATAWAQKHQRDATGDSN